MRENMHPIQPSNESRRGGLPVGVVIALVLLAVVFFFAWRSSRGAAGPKELTLEERYRLDQRVSLLLADCPFGAAFEVDTTDIASILATKLDAGAQLEPLRRAKTELALIGDEAAEPLTRLFRDAARSQFRGGVAKNVLTVCALTDGDWGVPLAVEALSSSSQDIRADGVIVIGNHPAPEHYDVLELVMPGFNLQPNLERCLKSMHACDPDRFARQLIDEWIPAGEPEVDGEYIVSIIVDTGLPLIASTVDEETAMELVGLLDTTRGFLERHIPYLHAGAARFGHEPSLEALRNRLAHAQRKPRYHAAQALAMAGHVHDVYPIFAMSQDKQERAETLSMILQSEQERTPEQQADVIDWSRRALADPAPEVREVALKGLLRAGDEEGFAFLLNLVNGSVIDRGLAMRAMRDALDDQPDWCDQIRSVLIGQWEREAQGGQRGVELTSILSTMGAVPGRATGEFCLQAADAILDNPVNGVRGFQWAIGQAFNAGDEARDVLRERFAVEEKPFNRIDLIYFLWQDFSSESLDALLAVVDDESRSPYERLYAAGSVVKMRNSKKVLPVLKRVHRSTNDAVLRNGLHCLLWSWFGPPLS